MRKVLLHIGLPKTATSTIQTGLSGFNQITNIGKKYPWRTPEYDSIEQNEFWRAKAHQPESEYDVEVVRSKLRSILNDSDEPIFISNEDLSYQTYQDNLVKLRRLKELFPEAEIILFIRNQVSWLKSYYSMLPQSPFIPVIGNKHLTFDQWIDLCFKHYNYSHLPGLNYLKLMENIESLFGNVQIFIFEEFVKSKSKFAQYLSSNLDLDLKEVTSKLEERTNTATDAKVVHFYNRYLKPMGLKNILGENTKKLIYRQLAMILPNKDKSLSIHNEKRIFDLFKDSNRQLSEKYNLSLKEFGYY